MVAVCPVFMVLSNQFWSFSFPVLSLLMTSSFSVGSNVIYMRDGSQLYAVLVSSTSLNSRTALPTTQMDMNVSQTSQICCVLD